MKPSRNDPCPCGSGKKYKKCCLAKDEAAQIAELAAAQAAAAAAAEAAKEEASDEAKDEAEKTKPGAKRSTTGRSGGQAHRRPGKSAVAPSMFRRRAGTD